jgi:DNA repair exonuclease SbcCD ATPase subunit
MLEELRIRNWKAFGEKTIRFGPGLNLFVGPNGIGKTTVLDAVCLALTGQIPAGDFKALVRETSKDAAIELDLVSGGVRYSINRRFSRDRIISAEWVKDNSRAAQPGWDALSSELARELKTDPLFFSRMVYMSEVEVFEYAKNPPAGALNNALERVLGIDSLRSLANFAERLGKTYAKNAAGLRQELMRSAQQSEEPVLDDTQTREDLTRDKSELEAIKGDVERIQVEAQRLRLISNNLTKATTLSGVLRQACTDLGIDLVNGLPTLGGIPDIRRFAEERTEKLNEHVRQVSAEKGNIEGSLQYLTNIRQLLSSVIQTPIDVGPPCPVCERPIDGDLATRLIAKTEMRIAESREALRRFDESLREGQSQLQKYRASAQRFDTVATQLEVLSQSVRDMGITFEPSIVDELARRIGLQAQETETDLKRLQNRSAELDKKVTTGAASLGRAEGRAELLKIREDMRRQLVQKFKGSILSETLVQSLRDLIIDQRDEGIKPLYLALAELWKRWRPGHEWAITFDTEGRIELGSRDMNLKFSQLSGGEKTVLLILSRVLMLGLLSQMDFLMIDEPLEHLDLRNRRAVLNFLVASTQRGLVKQAVVTTFEESLVRKYLEGQGTNTIYLSQSAA